MINKVISLFLIALLFPILILICLIIIWSDGFPILFKQKRVGKDDSIFKIYKFRTMKNNAPNCATDLLDNSLDLFIKSGKILRKFSLDELPQLINIFKGEMHFIGPRPLLYNQYTLRKIRNENGTSNLKPGITGWAQINGRDQISDSEKSILDLYYLNNKNLKLNVKIIFYTFLKVIRADNIKS